MKQIKVLIPMLFLALFSFSQERMTVEKMREIKKQEKATAQESIIKLNNGILLVRLDFKFQKIKYLEEHNYFDEAEKLRKKQVKANQQIILAFDSLFHFCPVYFFPMIDSRLVLDKKFKEVRFYDINCLVDSTIQMSTENYLIGEFGTVKQDVSNNEGSKNSMHAFVIHTDDFVQLRSPFPYYEKYMNNWFVKKRYRMPLIRINEKLNSYSGT